MNSLLQFSRRNFAFTYPCPRKLREIVRISLFEKEQPSKIEEVWNDYHNAKPHVVSKVITTQHYMQLLSNGQHSPMFIYPVPKEAGYFMLLSQNQQKSFVKIPSCFIIIQIFTYLEDFKKNPLAANPYLVLTCFDELVRSKGIALIRGDVIGQLTKDEGETIMNKLLNSYLIDSQYERVKQFNHTPQQFNYEEYQEEAMTDFKKVLNEVKLTRPKQKDIGRPVQQGWWLQ